MIRLLGGRRLHPVFAVTGGVNKSLKVEERDTILKGIDGAIEAVIGLGIMADWAAKNAETSLRCSRRATLAWSRQKCAGIV